MKDVKIAAYKLRNGMHFLVLCGNFKQLMSADRALFFNLLALFSFQHGIKVKV